MIAVLYIFPNIHIKTWFKIKCSHGNVTFRNTTIFLWMWTRRILFL